VNLSVHPIYTITRNLSRLQDRDMGSKKQASKQSTETDMLDYAAERAAEARRKEFQRQLEAERTTQSVSNTSDLWRPDRLIAAGPPPGEKARIGGTKRD